MQGYSNSLYRLSLVRFRFLQIVLKFFKALSRTRGSSPALHDLSRIPTDRNLNTYQDLFTIRKSICFNVIIQNILCETTHINGLLSEVKQLDLIRARLMAQCSTPWWRRGPLAALRAAPAARFSAEINAPIDSELYTRTVVISTMMVIIANSCVRVHSW